MPKHDPKLYEQGTKLISYQYQRDLPEVKSTNYLMAVYLRTAMRQAAASDVLYHDGSFALETSRSNLFVVTQKGTLITPRERILKGITRKHLLKVATELMPVEERELGLEEVWQAQEVFISSTTKGAMPVRQIDDYIIADGKPGPITRLLRETFETYLCDYLARAQPLASS
jgi:D-alanine transaminase/branched-chain amino acid aminotransferase